jgi:diguanylate cyclase (GGDEF)-like protein
LKSLVKIVTKAIRAIDIFARWGGEEFVILAPETGTQAAVDLAERLRNEIEWHTFDTGEKITASFGVVYLKSDDFSDSFIKRADEALYRAKKTGRNRVETDDI